MDVVLNETHLEDALYAFARGKNTTQVVDGLIASNGWDDTKSVRAKVRELLRPVNPVDTRFSKTKYGQLYESARQAVLDVLREESRVAFRSAIESLSGDLQQFDEIGATLLSLMDNVSDADVTSNSEFVNTVRAYTGLQKAKVDGVLAISTLVEMLARLPSLGKTD